jgi:hypothetical protein
VADILREAQLQGILERKVQFDMLGMEIDTVHIADNLYRNAPLPQNHQAEDDYKRWQDRLVEIRRELSQLRN